MDSAQRPEVLKIADGSRFTFVDLEIEDEDLEIMESIFSIFEPTLTALFDGYPKGACNLAIRMIGSYLDWASVPGQRVSPVGGTFHGIQDGENPDQFLEHVGFPHYFFVSRCGTAVMDPTATQFKQVRDLTRRGETFRHWRIFRPDHPCFALYEVNQGIEDIFGAA